MDQAQYSKLMPVLETISDPRKARGKQLEWRFILGIIAAALLCQHRSAAAIAQWAVEHADQLCTTFQPARGRVPSESTIRRALQRVDAVSVERQLLQVEQPCPLPPSTGPLHGQSIDGKHVRGAGAHGHPTLLVSLVQHTDGRVVGQTAVAQKRHESRAVPDLLVNRDLHGVVVTMDAGLTQNTIASQILAQGGHYLMVVKRNRHELYDDLTWFFATPPLPCERPWQEVTTVSKGHGRLETRRVTCTDDLDDYLDWPGVQQILRRECERVQLKSGEVGRAVTYGITSLPACLAPPAVIEGLWRGHWTIENRRHYVRDVTLGEDAHQMHVGAAPRVLAALRNSLITLVRRAGWTNVAAGFRHLGATPLAALEFLGVTPP